MQEVSLAGGVETEFSLVLEPVQNEYVGNSKLWTSKLETLPREANGRIKLGSMRTTPAKKTEKLSQKESAPRRFNIPIPSDDAIDIVDLRPYDLPSIAPGLEEEDGIRWTCSQLTMPLTRDPPMESHGRPHHPPDRPSPVETDAKSLKVVTSLLKDSKLVHIPRPKSVAVAKPPTENAVPNIKVGELTRLVQKRKASMSVHSKTRRTTAAVKGSPVPLRPSIVTKNVRVEMIKSLGGVTRGPPSKIRGKKSIFN